MNTIPVLSLDEIEEDRPMPSRNHSIALQNLGGLLFPFRDRVSVHQQLSLNLDGWQSIPDICAYPRDKMPHDWLTDEAECMLAPSLVIEVLSPKQTLQPLVDTVRE